MISFSKAVPVSKPSQTEATQALLNWKANLIHVQGALRSWDSTTRNKTTSSPCGWFGISCNNEGCVTEINLSHKALEGQLNAFNFSSFPGLVHLNLNNNSLNGTISEGIGSLSNLVQLSLSFNKLEGTMPRELGLLTQLQILELASNQIVGNIRQELSEMVSLSLIDLSNNHLEGSVPSTTRANLQWVLSNNTGLCGEVHGLTSCRESHHGPSPARKIIDIISFVVTNVLLAFLLVIVAIIFYRWRKQQRSAKVGAAKAKGDLFAIWNIDEKITYEHIIEATEDFNAKYCIGSGGYGSVYKAELPTGQIVASKKFKQLEGGVLTKEESFITEIQVLRKNKASKHSETLWVLFQAWMHVSYIRVYGKRKLIWDLKK